MKTNMEAMRCKLIEIEKAKHKIEDELKTQLLVQNSNKTEITSLNLNVSDLTQEIEQLKNKLAETHQNLSISRSEHQTLVYDIASEKVSNGILTEQIERKKFMFEQAKSCAEGLERRRVIDEDNHELSLDSLQDELSKALDDKKTMEAELNDITYQLKESRM